MVWMTKKEQILIARKRLMSVFTCLCADLVESISKAIRRIETDPIDPYQFHKEVKMYYSWGDVAERTEKVRMFGFCVGNAFELTRNIFHSMFRFTIAWLDGRHYPWQIG
jgi:aryl-alcohol dehydrogenase-like predicted oxidoreductase